MSRRGGDGEPSEMGSWRIDRRQALKTGAALGAAGVLPWTSRRVAALPPSSPRLDPSSLTKYVEPLPNPLDPSFLMERQDVPNEPNYRVKIKQFRHRVHQDLRPTPVYAYQDVVGDSPPTYPGKTFVVDQNDPVTVEWSTAIPTQRDHLLPLDTSVHGAGPGNPTNRFGSHLHGGLTDSAFDGGPESWFTLNGPNGDDYVTNHYTYHNRNPASVLWYHDHALGITRLNVYAGLAGFYIVRDLDERELIGAADGLPAEAFEIPIVFQDRSFHEDGSLFYPFETTVETDDGETTYGTEDEPSVVPEFFGDVSVVNGKAWPSASVEPRRYRFRFLNGCNSRFLNLGLFATDGNGGPDLETPGPTIWQIASDGGFLDEAVDLPSNIAGESPQRGLLLAPAERGDFIIDFTGHDGEQFVLYNNADSPFKGANYVSSGDTPEEPPLHEIMRFDVGGSTSSEDESAEPGKLVLPEPTFYTDDGDSYTLSNPLPAREEIRDWVLVEGMEEVGDPPVGERLELLLATRAHFEAKGTGQEWEDQPEVVDHGRTETWRLFNTTEDVHPIHLHMVQFEIVSRHAFDAERYLDDVAGPSIESIEEYVGAARPVDPNEMGPKDTVRANPEEVTTIEVPFGVRALNNLETGGDSPISVWHCHILEHEDNEMMRPYTITPPEE